MQRIQETTNHRLALTPHQRTDAEFPAAFLSLAQIVSLAEKRLRWYGFAEWRIHDVICNHDHTVSILVRVRNQVVATLTFTRDCGAVHYGIHMPTALKLAPAFSIHTMADARGDVLKPAASGNVKKRGLVERRRELSSAERKREGQRAAVADRDPPVVDLPPDYNERAFGRGRAMLSSLAENR